MMMRGVGLSVACACALVAGLFAAPASAATTPCWKTVIADWSKDNSVDGRYPASCIRQAMVNAPADLKIYSSLEEDLQSAMRVRSVRRLSGVHTAAATLPSGGSSPLSRLVIVLAGIAVL